MDIVVTGGTGRLGRRLTEQLSAAGHTVRQTSRRGEGVRVVPAPVPGTLSTALREGGLLPRGGARGRVTYAEHLG